jgi:hypothetical protein
VAVERRETNEVIPRIASAICLLVLSRLQSRGGKKSKLGSIIELKRQRLELRRAEVAEICRQNTQKGETNGKRGSRKLH